MMSYGPLLSAGNQIDRANAWADSVLAQLTLDQKLGQLFMVAAYSDKNEEFNAGLETLVTQYHVGGLLFFQGGPKRQLRLVNRFQEKATIPLLIGMDLEWGLGMRLDSTISFPKQITLGAIEDNSLIYEMGREIARQCKSIGVHINFAPVADINSNSRNPVIGVRSFGEDKKKVATKALAYMKGLQDGGIIACAKHFPGHGNTFSDSHIKIPTLHNSAQGLRETEIYPFERLFQNGLQATMIGHLGVPALDDSALPASLSSKVVTELLSNGLSFEGLTITDALNMKSLVGYQKDEGPELLAFEAGNDLLLLPANLPRARESLKSALSRGQITVDQLNRRVHKILKAKFWSGLDKWQPLSPGKLDQRLNNPHALNLKRQLLQAAITVASNAFGLLPITVLDTNSIGSLSLGINRTSEFQDYLNRFTDVDSYYLQDSEDLGLIKERLSDYETLVVGIHNLNNSASGKYGLRNEHLKLIAELGRLTNLVVVVFGNPYSLTYLDEIPSLICAYEDNPWVQRIAAQVIFGAVGSQGTLPVTASPAMLQGGGFKTQDLGRLGYSLPEAVGMDSKVLARIDSIMKSTITGRAAPGGQIVVARKGQVVYQRPFGYHTYDSIRPVTNNTLYDLASVSKVAATLQAMMFLDGKGILATSHKASSYLDDLKNTDKEDITLEEILIHQAGLIPFVPFWKRTLDDKGKHNPVYYNDRFSQAYPHEITPVLFGSTQLMDSLWFWVVNYPIRQRVPYQKNHKYEYSDIGYYYLLPIINQLLNQRMEEFLAENFYGPIGLKSLTYKPLSKHGCEKIAPTEREKSFRHQLLCGLVHDSGASIFGGIAAHAGLFSNALDLAKLMQMNLQNGEYGGIRYLHPRSIEKYTQFHVADNRRGLGWDKPEQRNYRGPTSDFATSRTYGHTGFTGTAVWVDPGFELIYVFLSNRIYPNADNEELIEKNIRTRIQDVLYESIWSYESTQAW